MALKKTFDDFPKLEEDPDHDGNVLFFFSIPPFFTGIIKPNHLWYGVLVAFNSWRREVVTCANTYQGMEEVANLMRGNKKQNATNHTNACVIQIIQSAVLHHSHNSWLKNYIMTISASAPVIDKGFQVLGTLHIT